VDTGLGRERIIQQKSDPNIPSSDPRTETLPNVAVDTYCEWRHNSGPIGHVKNEGENAFRAGPDLEATAQTTRLGCIPGIPSQSRRDAEESEGMLDRLRTTASNNTISVENVRNIEHS
jgi:hypothetical protein